ncbi:MAG: glycosyltransferase family 2 protein [Anaerolineae bacterium]|jgi:GT2 family glycosyltransferase
MRRPHLAVVVVSWNVRELLASCLRSLFADLAASRTEPVVWVVDNASTDGTPKMVEALFPDVRIVPCSENRGFAAANNMALKRILLQSEADSDDSYAWLLNPDTEVQPGATAALMGALEQHGTVGVVGAKLLYPDGSLQQSAFRFPGLLQLAFELFPLPQRLYDTRLNGRYPRHLYESEEPFPIDHPLGASMMVRRETIEDVGLLDESFHMYCEEIDWCWRMRKANWNALCVPAASVVHHAGQSSSQVPIRSFVNLWTSRARLYARHQTSLKWRLAQAMVRVGMRRQMEGAPPEVVEACQQVIEAWGIAQ